MKVVLAPQAREDLREILAYIAADNPRAARVVLGRIRERILELRTHPHLGRPGRLPETRELVVPATPYAVPYQVRDSVVQVLRVYHGARRWPDRL